MAAKKILKLAMVGLRHGHVGSFGPKKPGYIHTFRQMDDVQIVAYCEDTDSELLDEGRKLDPSASFYSSLEDLIAEEDFDMACVILPANEIPQAGIKLAEAGKHFYMEKQFARRASDLAELVKAVRRNGVKVLPGYPWRFHPVAQDLRRVIDQDVLGKPLDIEVRMATYQVRPGNRDPSHFMYGKHTEGGGILHMLGGHYIEVMRFLMGCEIKSVQAMPGRPIGHIEEPLEDVAIVAYEFENGALGSMHCGYLIPRVGTQDTSLVYRGLDGWADWTPIGSSTLKVKSASPDWSGSPERTFEHTLPSKTGYGNSVWMFQWLQRFVQDIQAGREPALTVEDALNVLQSIDAAYESARTGRRVEVNYVATAPLGAAAS